MRTGCAQHGVGLRPAFPDAFDGERIAYDLGLAVCNKETEDWAANKVKGAEMKQRAGLARKEPALTYDAFGCTMGANRAPSALPKRHAPVVPTVDQAVGCWDLNPPQPEGEDEKKRE